MEMISFSELNELRPITGGEKYLSEWDYSNREVRFSGEELSDLLRRVDFNYIFGSLKELTINHIEKTGIVENFYAKRAAEKKQQPQSTKP
jgi:hypothetical protein